MIVHFDIETNEINDWVRLSDLKEIHCFCVSVDYGEPFVVDPNVGCNILGSARMVVGHNVIGFDLPALKKLLGFSFGGNVLDTLVLSRLLKTRLKNKLS